MEKGFGCGLVHVDGYHLGDGVQGIVFDLLERDANPSRVFLLFGEGLLEVLLAQDNDLEVFKVVEECFETDPDYRDDLLGILAE